MIPALSWKVWLLGLISWCALIYYLSDQSVLPLPHIFNMQDKLVHAAAYAALAWLFWHAGRRFMPLALLALATVLFCSLYGLSDEWHQSFVEGRQADVYDWLADSLGALLLTLTLWKREVVLLGRK